MPETIISLKFQVFVVSSVEENTKTRINSLLSCTIIGYSAQYITYHALLQQILPILEGIILALN